MPNCRANAVPVGVEVQASASGTNRRVTGLVVENHIEDGRGQCSLVVGIRGDQIAPRGTVNRMSGCVIAGLTLLEF